MFELKTAEGSFKSLKASDVAYKWEKIEKERESVRRKNSSPNGTKGRKVPHVAAS